MTGDITTKAMLASLSISVWSARKFDKKATQEVADFYGTDNKVGRYNKLLLPEGAETYKAITSAASAARQDFYVNTLPWADSGSRILPAANYIQFGTAMRKKEDAFHDALQPFLDQYPFLQARAKTVLNGMYSDADYPDRHDLKAYFAFDLAFFPIPDAKDFRVEIQQDEVDSIRQQIEATVKSSVQTAMEEPYRRLFDGVAHMAARFSGATTCPCRSCKGQTFKTDHVSDSTVTNLIDLCEVLPRLNLVGDPALDRLIEEVKTGLVGFAPEAIRSCEPIRKTLAERAAEIQRNLQGYMAA